MTQLVAAYRHHVLKASIFWLSEKLVFGVLHGALVGSMFGDLPKVADGIVSSPLHCKDRSGVVNRIPDLISVVPGVPQ